MKGLADARPFLLRVFQGSHHSPVGSAKDGDLWLAAIKGGSGLAHEEAGTFSIAVD
jgi:hypothetical protein